MEDYNLSGGLKAKLKGIVGEDVDMMIAESGEVFGNEFDTSTKVEARCPLCKQPCSISELRKWGTMNTRQQEKFCRSHRRTNAETKWSAKGYPDIDWERLDDRIAGHHDFIKNILRGAESHYRNAFEKLIAAGKGRSLRKMESNLIPGYYGTRGLNMISGHVIRELSGLLSARSVHDDLISKRGTTAFVQSVIVPEVAVQLIMEDMFIDDVEARNVLAESSKMGELVHEEIGDVVLEESGDDSADED